MVLMFFLQKLKKAEVVATILAPQIQIQIQIQIQTQITYKYNTNTCWRYLLMFIFLSENWKSLKWWQRCRHLHLCQQQANNCLIPSPFRIYTPYIPSPFRIYTPYIPSPFRIYSVKYFVPYILRILLPSIYTPQKLPSIEQFWYSFSLFFFFNLWNMWYCPLSEHF